VKEKLGFIGIGLMGGFADSLPLQIFGARMTARQFEPRPRGAERRARIRVRPSCRRSPKRS
jgi:hypothetical protein